MQSLVEKAATVNYRGPNARLFKKGCVDHALLFTEQTTAKMVQMNDAIEANTSFIATALGGQPITLQPPTVAISPPDISADESIEAAEDTALNQLRDDVESIYSAIVSLFEDNLANFRKLGIDGWWGPEYDLTLEALTRLTASAVEASNDSRAMMVNDIQTQIDMLF